MNRNVIENIVRDVFNKNKEISNEKSIEMQQEIVDRILHIFDPIAAVVAHDGFHLSPVQPVKLPLIVVDCKPFIKKKETKTRKKSQ